MKKEFVAWNKKWETGIKSIDEQHKHFVGIVNRAYSFNENGETKKVLSRILNDLTEFARIHFSTEEGYFEDTSYPEMEEHKEKHMQLLEKVLEFEKRFDKDKDVSELVKEFLVFLRSWLDDHLFKVDHKYVPWLTQHGIK